MAEIELRVACRKCNAIFDPELVQFEPFEQQGNIQVMPGLGLQILALSAEKKEVIQVSSTYELKTGDMLATCPMCEAVHLFGFAQVPQLAMQSS